MNIGGKHYRTIWPHTDGASVEVIDQTRLPHQFATLRLANLSEAVEAIRSMVVRGAPLIGVTAAYGLALAMRFDASDDELTQAYQALLKARPTAVLEIVRAAIRSTPKELHGDIVSAAVAGVPDPFSVNGQGKTLAESILDAAVEAGSGESRESLSASINSALGSTPNSESPAKTGTSSGDGSSGSIAGAATGGGGGSLATETLKVATISAAVRRA